MPRAPKRCGRPGCTRLVRGVVYCPDHVRPAWEGSSWGGGSTRRWRETRDFVLDRDDAICYWCGKPGANTVDHKLARAHGGTDDPANLGAIHSVPCHDEKTRADQGAR